MSGIVRRDPNDDSSFWLPEHWREVEPKIPGEARRFETNELIDDTIMFDDE